MFLPLEHSNSTWYFFVSPTMLLPNLQTSIANQFETGLQSWFSEQVHIDSEVATCYGWREVPPPSCSSFPRRKETRATMTWDFHVCLLCKLYWLLLWVHCWQSTVNGQGGPGVLPTHQLPLSGLWLLSLASLQGLLAQAGQTGTPFPLFLKKLNTFMSPRDRQAGNLARFHKPSTFLGKPWAWNGMQELAKHSQGRWSLQSSSSFSRNTGKLEKLCLRRSTETLSREAF